MRLTTSNGSVRSTLHSVRPSVNFSNGQLPYPSTYPLMRKLREASAFGRELHNLPLQPTAGFAGGG